MKPLAMILAVMLAQPVHALSCLEPGSFADAYGQASASDKPYVLVVGALSRLGGQQSEPREDLQGLLQSYTAKARFEGWRGGAEGFNQRFNEIITVNVTCIASWCGSVPIGGAVAFLEQRGSGYFLEVGPCPGFQIRRDDLLVRADAVACLQGRCPR
jgi:hypothetical protein